VLPPHQPEGEHEPFVCSGVLEPEKGTVTADGGSSMGSDGGCGTEKESVNLSIYLSISISIYLSS